ncbi:hypothetical protein BHE74_00000415 [Ensete ventricosum]|nr:hypothetical protein BHE74_00000415 [Ensete ventricosum]
MIGVAEDLDCSSAYIRLRGLDKSEDKAENCSENTNVLKQVVERGEEATTSPKGLSYRKAKRRSKWSVGRERGWGDRRGAGAIDGAAPGGVGSLSQELCACPPPPPPPGLGRGGCANCATYSAADRRAC